MTIMFSDVRGFTTISESYKSDPQGLTTLMNRFLTPLTNAILARKGTIDKYMGDAIMAFWNAPLDDKEHQLNACEAALDMLERIDALNKEREIESQNGGHTFIPINVGVGLNTGTCVVGNMGSNLRFDYSVLGDSVNLASRLEGQSKEYGFPIIVGSKTALAVKDKFAILELDFIMVKGKKEPEVIYAIAGREDTAQSGRFQRLRNLTIEMLACYRSRDWVGALEAIERGRKTDDAHSLEYLYNLYEARIRGYQESPPPEDWNGAFAHHTKQKGEKAKMTTPSPKEIKAIADVAGVPVSNEVATRIAGSIGPAFEGFAAVAGTLPFDLEPSTFLLAQTAKVEK